ncbi:MAG: SgcJ/EcaC family oxidoreductase [Proteobacteria bacterium]|nr:SgcJ/EcaC family oxidoreductase [Pseudomonadota bacterium]
MRRRIFPSLLGAAALAFTPLLAMAAPNDLAAKDLAEARPAIDKANAEWLPAMKAKDAEALAAAYAEDGVFVLPDGREIVGKAAIADFYRGRVAGLAQVLGGGIHHDGMTRARDGLIYEWGHGGATTIDQAGKPTTTNGPYLTVWKRGADGRWAIVRNLVF